MRNRLLLLLSAAVLAAMVALSACGSKETASHGGGEGSKAVPHVRVAAQNNSGQVFQFVAEERGFLKEEGVDSELVYINNATDAFTAMAAGQIDIMSTYGTGGPLIQIANGQDFTIFGGYMIIGETPVYGKPGTKWTGLDSFKGKTVAITRGGTPDIVLKGIFHDAGILKDVTFVEMKKNQETLQAVASGQADFGATATGYQLQAQALGLEVKMWPDEYWPNHSCCRMLSTSPWLAKPESQDAVYRLLRAYLRAEEYIQSESDKERLIDLVVEKLDLDRDTAASFILSPHMKYDTDPFRNSVLKMWDKMGAFGYLPDNSINCDDHINVAIYKKVLDSLVADYPDSEFFKKKRASFEQNNL